MSQRSGIVNSGGSRGVIPVNPSPIPLEDSPNVRRVSRFVPDGITDPEPILPSSISATGNTLPLQTSLMPNLMNQNFGVLGATNGKGKNNIFLYVVGFIIVVVLYFLIKKK